MKKLFLILLVIQSVLLIKVSLCGILISSTYIHETLNWQTQSIGQDIVDLFIATPVLLISGWLAYKGNRIGLFLYGGTQLFLLYTFLIYCFSVQFNYLFPAYCFLLGLSFYSLIQYLVIIDHQHINRWFSEKLPVKLFSVYFLITGIVFFMLWMSEVVPAAIKNLQPLSLTETGLVTNPVHVIDLALLLPGLIIVSGLIRKRKPQGFVWAPVLLAFFILMNINIMFLTVLMFSKGLVSSLVIAWVMGLLTLFSAVLFYLFLKHIQPYQKKVPSEVR